MVLDRGREVGLVDVRYSIQALAGERWMELYHERDRAKALQQAASIVRTYGTVRVVMQVSHHETIQTFIDED